MGRFDDSIGTRSGSRKALIGGPNAGNAAVAFNPTSLITGQGGFWRADKGVTQAGGNVSAWADQSSFANNLAVVNNDPAYSATGFNSSFPGISVTNGGGMNLQATANFASTTVSAFVLLQTKTLGAGFGRMIWLLGAGQSQTYNNTSSFEFDDGGSHNALNISANSSQQGNGGSTGPSISNSTLYLFGVVFNGTVANRYSAGSVVGSSSSWTNSLGGGAGAKFGMGLDPGGSDSDNYAFAFWGITQKAMNSTDWTNLKTWANSNFGTSF